MWPGVEVSVCVGCQIRLQDFGTWPVVKAWGDFVSRIPNEDVIFRVVNAGTWAGGQGLGRFVSQIPNEDVNVLVVNAGKYLGIIVRGVRMNPSMNLVVNLGANSDDLTQGLR